MQLEKGAGQYAPLTWSGGLRRAGDKTHGSLPPATPGYTLVRRDRPGGGGGLAFLIWQDVQFSHLDTNQFFPGDLTTEHQGILANLSGHQIACLNIYIPPGPAAQLASFYQPQLWSPSHSHQSCGRVEEPQDSCKSDPILHNNYRRADWASYTDYTETATSALPPPPPVRSAKRPSGISSGMPACASSQEAQSPITPPTSLMQPNASLLSMIAWEPQTLRIQK